MKFLYLFLFLFLFSLVSAGLNIGYNLEEDVNNVILVVPEEPINYSITTTNIYNNYTYNGSDLELDDISDVNASSPADGESLVWSSSLTKWISEKISGWFVSTDNGFLYNDSDTLYFNDTKLNDTIDARAASVETDFEVFINSSAYDDVHYNITEGDADDVEFVIEPGKKFIFGDTFT